MVPYRNERIRDDVPQGGDQMGDINVGPRAISSTPVKTWRCTVPYCPVTTLFTRHSEYKKHKDRHDRPFRCDIAACQAKSFGDAGGLYRHKREVHRHRDDNQPIMEFACPDPSCERHKRGFPRRWNLREHQRRVHSLHKEATDDSEMITRQKRPRSDSASSVSAPEYSPVSSVGENVAKCHRTMSFTSINSVMNEDPDRKTDTPAAPKNKPAGEKNQTSICMVSTFLRRELAQREAEVSMLESSRKVVLDDIQHYREVLSRYKVKETEQHSHDIKSAATPHGQQLEQKPTVRSASAGSDSQEVKHVLLRDLEKGESTLRTSDAKLEAYKREIQAYKALLPRYESEAAEEALAIQQSNLEKPGQSSLWRKSTGSSEMQQNKVVKKARIEGQMEAPDASKRGQD